jgi:hypothetical protein
VPRAIVNEVTLAESDHTEVVEDNYYFPPESVNLDLFRESDTRKAAPGRATRAITPSRRAEKPSRTPPGTTRSRKTPRRT